jgi:HAD superfamily hydrolase (TIGR01450 family)
MNPGGVSRATSTARGSAVTLLDGYDLLIVDLDGVVYLGTQPIPGAVAALTAAAERGIGVEYVTNNASRRAGEVARLLSSLGLKVRADQVVTSGQTAAGLLAAELAAGSPVLVIGSPALAEEVRDVGLVPVRDAEARPVAVVQGYGPATGWSDLAEACIAIRAGARWVASNLDPMMPSPRGPLPGNGSLVAALRTALGGREPDVVVGKPSPTLFQAAARRVGARAPLVLGDGLGTDIAGAHAAGMASLLVLTGVTTGEDIRRAVPDRRPTYLSYDLSGLSRQDSAIRIPPPGDEVSDGGWQARRDGEGTELTGAGEFDAAVRALAATAWSRDIPGSVRAGSPSAADVLAWLDRPASPDR